MNHHDDFEIKKDYAGESIKFNIYGYMNYINAPLLQYELEEALKEDKGTIVLNMSRVSFICAIGMKVISDASKQAKEEDKKIIIERPSAFVKNVLGTDMLKELSGESA
jgi:anti-anti-sigma factor